MTKATMAKLMREEMVLGSEALDAGLTTRSPLRPVTSS